MLWVLPQHMPSNILIGKLLMAQLTFNIHLVLVLFLSMGDQFTFRTEESWKISAKPTRPGHLTLVIKEFILIILNQMVQRI
jgi:hypothetical protein